MKALTQSGVLSGSMAAGGGGNAIKRRRMLVGTRDLRIVDKKGSYGHCIVKDSSLVSDRAKLLASPLTGRRRRFSPVVSFKSSSDSDVERHTADESFAEKDGHSSEGIKGGLSNLVTAPFSGFDPGSVRKELIALALPAIIGQAIDPLAQLMETAYIGRLGPVELASAGISMSIFNIISKLFNVPLLSITTSFVAEDISKNSSSHYVSDGDLQEDNIAEKTISNQMAERLKLPSVSTALFLAAGIGTIEALALFLGSGLFLNMMGISPASPMHSTSKQFLSLRALGAPAVVISLAVQGVFRGFKDTRTPLFCAGLGNLLAVGLFPILIYYFHFGVTGAAIATVASQYITTFLLLWSLSKKAVILPPKIGDLQFGGYIKSGGLLLGRTLSVLITMTLGTSMAARQGPLAMAAHQICLQVWLAVSLLSDALALSAQALIASSFAKSDYEKVKEITFYVLKIGLFTGIILAAFLWASFGNLAELFTKDTGVLEIVRTGVLFVSASQPINALAFIFDGLHYGLSDFSYSAWSMMLVGTLSSMFLLYAPSIFGLAGVWSGLTLFMSLRMAAGFTRLCWKTGPWWFLQQDIRISEPQHNYQRKQRKI